MNIIVVGCGKIGTAILDTLLSEGHNVTAVDSDPAVIDEITNIYDVMGVCGNGTDCEVLQQADVGSTNLLVATTHSDELNMLCCFLARRMGARHTIARIRNPEYNDQSLGFMKDQLGLSMSINPELLTAQELYNLLRLPSAANLETFSGRNFEMVELALKSDSVLNGLSLLELRKRCPANFLVCAVRRGDCVTIPDGRFVLKDGDHVILTAAFSEIQKLLKSLGLMKKHARTVMLLGASRTAYYLAKMLLKSGHSVKVIEKDIHRCEEFGQHLPGATMICGDGSSQELLLEEGIRSTDAFVSLTGMDEQNILISFYASSQNVPKVISKVNLPQMNAMAQRLGMDSLVSLPKAVTNVVSRYARALENSLGSQMETLYKLLDGKAEALEFIVKADFPYCNTLLKDLRLKENTLFAGIIRKRKTIIPSGDDCILAGDRVIVVSTGKRLGALLDVMS